MVYVILGMHKSGTTLVSDLLHQSGINMIPNGVSVPDYDHKQGKMERPTFLKLNNLLLESENIISLDIPVKMDAVVDMATQSAIQKEISQCGELYTNWGFKDPRTCLTYPIWKKFLPEHKIIAVFRHPKQVMSHYLKYFNYPKKIEIACKALKAYYIYNKYIVEYMSDTTTPSILINYHDLMTKKGVMVELEKFIHTALMDVRKPQQYRKQKTDETTIKLFESLFKEKPLKIYEEMERIKLHL